MERKTKEIAKFQIIVPEKPTILGFKERNPDSFYKFGYDMIDRHFQGSEKFLPGQEYNAKMETLFGDWKLEDINYYIMDKNGLLPNIFGLLLAFEQGERYFPQRIDWHITKTNRNNNRGANILGVDIPKQLWFGDSSGNLPLVCYIQSSSYWNFELCDSSLGFGNGEDIIVYFEKIQVNK